MNKWEGNNTHDRKREQGHGWGRRVQVGWGREMEERHVTHISPEYVRKATRNQLAIMSSEVAQCDG